MKRFLILSVVFGLVVGSVTTAEAKKTKPSSRVERTVVSDYASPWALYETHCYEVRGRGCVTVKTRASEAFFNAKITDAHGQPVAVLVSVGRKNSHRELGTFCGETTEPIAFDAGENLYFTVGWPDPELLATCPPGLATTGTVRVTLSNLP